MMCGPREVLVAEGRGMVTMDVGLVLLSPLGAQQYDVRAP